MKKVINHFMWGFQQHFRISVELTIQDILSQVGLETYDKVKVLLIGLATRDGLNHAICIEPEDGPLV